MLFSTIGQIYVFLWMIGAGMAVGLLCLLFAGLRRLLEAGFWLSLALDALLGLCAALILILAILIASYGSVRLYELLGALTGAILFRLGIEPPLKYAAVRVHSGLLRAFRQIAKFRLIKVIFR